MRASLLKVLNSSFFVLSLFFAAPSSNAQGSFQNLGFEFGTLMPIPGDPWNRVYFDPAFPGWRGYVGGIQETAAFHNATFLCCSALTLWGGESRPHLPIEGTYGAFLQAGWRLGTQQPGNTSLAQTGLIPGDAQSILFRSRLFGEEPFEVSLSGQTVPVVTMEITPNYHLLGADISAWAGQQSELRFTAVAPSDGSVVEWIVDSIQFSTTPIPEPSTLALFAVAGVLGCLYYRRKRR
jgi:hypothetical protein